MSKFIAYLFLFYSFYVFPQTIIVSPQQSNSVKFLAKSTFTDFEGTTSAIEGNITWDSSLTNKSEINLKVYLDSLDTGIGLRNSHMRDKYLETKKYPTADFTGKIISADKISNLESDVVVEGSLKIHGIKKSYKIRGKIFNYGKLYKIEAGFKINLEDFKIDQPAFLFNKVDNEIGIELVVYFIRK